MAEGFVADDEGADPTPIVPLPELGPQRPRRRHLVVLWMAVAVLLALQAALALYLRAKKRAGRAVPAHVATVPARRPPTKALPLQRDAAGPIAPNTAAPREASPVAGRAADQHRPVAKRRRRTGRPSKAGRPPKAVTRRRTEEPSAAASLRVTGRPVSDVTVPAALSGNADKGQRLFRMGCGLCHGRTAPAISASRYSAKQWSLFFGRGVHGQYKRLSAHFTRAELADIKAYLIATARGR